MENSFQFTMLMTLALAAGIGAQVAANFLKVPAIVILLPLGVILGPDGLGWLHPQALGVGLEVLVSLAVALILFEGGLNLRFEQLSQVSRSLRNLVTIGAAITCVGASIAAHYLSEFPWSLAWLYGSLVVVTGPTVINPILKRVRVDSAISTLLEGEGVLIDPIGAILAVVVLQVVLSGQTDLVTAAEQLGIRLVVGAAIGAGAGWLMGIFLLWSREYLTEDLRNSVVLAGALLVFVLSQSLLSESGLMAAVVAGMVVRQQADIAERGVRQFHSQLVVLAISVLFILLTAGLSLQAMLAMGWGSIGTVLLLMLVVRPLSIWICTWGSDLEWRQKLFLSWMAPRGIVAASVVSLFAILLTEHGVTGGTALKALVFLTIAMTVMIQGISASVVARLLKLDEGSTTVIIGDHPLTQSLARLLRAQDQTVRLVPLLAAGEVAEERIAESTRNGHHPQDSDSVVDPSVPQAPSLGKEKAKSGANLEPAVVEALASDLEPEDILTESMLLKADIEHADTLIIMTLNPQVNWAIAELSIKLFESARIWTPLSPGMPVSDGIRTLNNSFDQILRWAHYLEAGAAQLRSITLPSLATLGLGKALTPQIPSGDMGVSAHAGFGDRTFERIRDHFIRRIQSDHCLPLLLLRPEAQLFSQEGSHRLFFLPEPEIWHRGDKVYLLERAPSSNVSFPLTSPVDNTMSLTSQRITA